MLDAEEYQLCRQAILGGKKFVEKEIEKRDLSKCIWLDEIPVDISFERFRYFLEMYRVLTGFTETNHAAVMHHRIEQYGEDCLNCSKPLRTPQANFCAACGFTKGKKIS